jgi:PhoH-like ATPase
MAPWISPIRDNFSFLFNNKKPKTRRQLDGDKPRNDDGEYLSLLQAKGFVEIEAITYIRGRTLPNSFILIDEVQNTTIHELKTIITRVGDDTKIVLTGDIDQIDNVHVDVFTNGLTYAVERFKYYPIAGHVTLLRGERSELATLASKIL